MRAFLALLIIILSLLSAAWTQAGESSHQPAKPLNRPKIGLVLGGGGAKGLSHVGVIRVLEENHIPVDVVAGTSMGAIVGALYASGYSADELESIITEMDWHEVFNDKTSRSRSTFRRKADEFGFLTDYKISFKNGSIVLPEGLIQGQNLFLELSRLLSGTRSVGRFEDLPIPFRLVATDLDTGEAVVMKDGDLASAVFASMAIPGLIPPVERDGHYLIDGGLVNNVPVDLARELGADIVIVVNVGTDPKPAKDINNFIEVLRQTQIVLTKKNTEERLKSLTKQDILIEPDLKGLGAGNFEQAEELVEHGAEATTAVLPKLKHLQLDDKAWLKHLMGRLAVEQKYPVISRIEVSQNSKLTDEIIKTGIHQKIGEVLEPERLNKDIDRLYGNGLYDRITYKIEKDGDDNILHINAKAKETSDGYFKFGVQLDSNLENKSSFKLGVSYTKPLVNSWGGEWRSEANIGDTVELTSEFYQPLGANQRFFVEPLVFLSRNKTDLFDVSKTRHGEIKSLTYGGGVQGGLLLGRWGEIRTGFTTSRFKLSFTDPLFKPAGRTITDSSILGRFTIDRLDSLSFPTKGGILIAEYQIHNDFFGGKTKYNKLEFNSFKPFTKGRHTFGVGTRVSGSTGRDANLIDRPSLGGFLSLSGFSEDELSGQYAAMVFSTYYYRLNKQAPLFDLPLYLGGSLELGNVYQDFDKISLDEAILAGSLFSGMKSPLGPIYVGIGYNDKGNTSLYFSIGTFF